MKPYYCNGKFICTYSNDTTAVNLHDGIKAYIAYEYANDEANTLDVDGTLSMRRMSYVPANVGVVLIADYEDVSGYITEEIGDDEPTNGSQYTLPNLLWARTESSVTDSASYCKLWTQYTTNSYSEDNWHNFLLPGEGVKVGDGDGTLTSDMAAADFDENGDVSMRYFALSLYSNTKSGKAANVDKTSTSNYFGFFRFNAGATVKKGIAYLYLPTKQEDATALYGCLDANGQLLSKLSDLDDVSYSSKGISRMIFDDMEGDDEVETETESTTTGITTIQETVASTDDNAYYTLQGVRVTTPCCGIYIHNGKKIIIR